LLLVFFPLRALAFLFDPFLAGRTLFLGLRFLTACGASLTGATT